MSPASRQTVFPFHERVLCLSDLHIGSPVSRYSHYKEDIDRLMRNADHVVLNGDIFEMFHLLKPKEMGGEDVIRKAVDDALQWLEKRLAESPSRQIHFVLGNHENLRRFRSRLDKLQHDYPANFHWHPEGIAIGDMLFVHGDLQESDQTDATRHQYRIPEATKHRNRSAGILNAFYEPGCMVRNLKHGARKDSKRILRHLEACAEYGSTHEEELIKLDGFALRGSNRAREKELKEIEKNTLFFLRDGEKEPELLTTSQLKQFKHITFGHTHIPFDYQWQEEDWHGKEWQGMVFHNTGALVRNTIKKPKPGDRIQLPFLECALDAQGHMINIRQSDPLAVPRQDV